MILSDITIKERLISGDLSITVDGNSIIDNPNSIQPASVDLRLGKNFCIPTDNTVTLKPRGEVGRVMDLIMKPAYTYPKTNGTFQIEPKEFVLATTMEYIKIPNDLTAFVEGRSSVGRLGLFVQNAGWVDPGFEGEITLELFNATNYPIVLISGMRVAQLVFAQLDRPCENPYKGKYQGQKGATPTKISADSDLGLTK